MADEDSTSVRWFVGVVIALLAAGGGIVALLNYFSAPTIEKFEASPPEVIADGTATLAWRVAEASSVEIKPKMGIVALEGNRQVRPSATTTYQLVARKNWGTSKAEQRIVVVPRQSGRALTQPTLQEPTPGEAKVIMHNDSQTTIIHVYFGTAQWSGWSGEQLSDPIPPAGTHTRPRLQPGAGIYDLKAEDAHHNVLDQQMGVSIRGTYDWHVGGKP